MKIGNKIRKIRELKNITPKDMADRLNISPQGYNRIERDEVGINIDRLLEVAGIFDMKPEELLTFDEKMVFNNNENKGGVLGVNYGPIHNFPEEMKTLYENQIKLQAEMITLLQEKIKGFDGK